MGARIDRIATDVSYPVADTVELETRTIVLFETEGKAASSTELNNHVRLHEGQEPPWTPSVRNIEPNTNVCAVDANGELSWIVEPQVSARSGARYTAIGTQLAPPEGDDVWVRCSDGRVHRAASDSSSVWARHTNGYAYVLDVTDGTIVERCAGGTGTVHVGGTARSFEYPVRTTLTVETYTVVLLEAYRFAPISDNRTDRFHRNIVALDETGAQVWQVEGLPTTNISGGYRDVWIEDGSLYAKHDVYGTVRIDPFSGTVTETGAATRLNLLCIDAETAAVFPEGLGNALHRGSHVVTRVAPERWSDDAYLYQSSDSVTDLTPLPEPIADIDDVPAERNVVAVDTAGSVQWTVDPAPADGEDPRYIEVGTHLQFGDAVWAAHSNGRVYRIDERDGSHSATRSRSELHFTDRVVEFPAAVDTVIETDETVVVLLDTDEPSGSGTAIGEDRDDLRLNSDILADRNVLGFDRVGRLEWVIDTVRPGSPYLNIWLEDGAIGFGNWGSCQGTVDPATGEILDSYFAK